MKYTTDSIKNCIKKTTRDMVNITGCNKPSAHDTWWRLITHPVKIM